MGKLKNLKRSRDVEEDDDVASEEETAKPSKKPTKKTETVSAGTSAQDEEGNTYWPLSNTRRINISEFKGKVLVNIREYYTDQTGELRPGKKGISLSLDQYNSFIKAIPDINAQLNEQGHETADITSSAAAAAAPSSSSKPSMKDAKESKKQKGKSSKSNIEATSEEDDESE
ncbi:hypothetical protein DL766_009895 [Monosporascus sp. MC13-8B]|uniref:Transcriptional coactivator p15 (PC4) C-terminal domain-containing protein n=1 Tax=Monosporascus cannonballus TaxID=155416 RepID=A0ABY0HIR5_9PEZI|nr:hypothetical protein DL763_009535 [Monosporascus cannonballus]RYO94022.1 hypothetical protein DL762_000770 [Monosporascus cannonballus]RYP13032.1 hypothetical protein DL766_009895 [Monosporascus sp. MC13-8B]